MSSPTKFPHLDGQAVRKKDCILHKEQPTSRNPKSTLMASSAVKVAIGLVLLVLVLATLGKLIEEWVTVLWLASLGGRFWGAVSVGIICIAFIAWACLVSRGLKEKKAPVGPGASKRKRVLLCWLIATQIVGVAIFIVANIALNDSYDSFSGLNIYQQIAVVVMRASYFAVGAYVLGALEAIGHGED